MPSTKPKLAMYWAASCGGCEIALANVHELILEVDAHFDFMFCPCLLDTKKKDIEALDDGAIFLTFFNGALRTEENVEMAELLRAKSQVLVAFGACAANGGIPALANHHGLAHLLDTVYCSVPSVDNPQRIYPQTSSQVAEGELTLPGMLPRVLALHDMVKVDYTMPGCPPEPEQIAAVIQHVISGKPLPHVGAMLGCHAKSVCDECPREKRGVLAPRLVRTYEAIPEDGWCLVEQGFACMGRSTRGGCEALCPTRNMPCTGCYGPIDRHADPGAAALTALAAVVDPGKGHLKDEEALHQRLDAALAGVADPLGTFYRYTMSECVVADRSAHAHADKGQ
ncbi:F420-non-reducing hydrogenase subunit G [Candidatus Symbiobacter mobilis]|uniref:F420-non-reducing hydrogenase subunit G n=1 Tax=Candidatus Symbiobacter mobilis CR TaxID=946483 RepID=U5NDG2_9BURK|nr:F420-non-reducing hydrogenase subunit G [Candidatus Symbiobacter mobilis]AGX88214.1 F420-non-reducing hydrogenase subunit G [Candidatus Symbiobacter mobilis CR]